MDNKDSFIIFGQYYGTSIMSRLIKWRTWSPISHTAILSQDEQYVYEAWRKGITKTPWAESHHKPGTKVDLYKVPCSKEEAKKAYEYYESKIGTPYDFRGIIGFALRLPYQALDLLFCSEYGFNGTLHFTQQLLKRIEAHKVSPGHLNISPILEPYKTVYTV